MAITVVRLTTQAQFVRLHTALAGFFDPVVQCSPDAFYPSMGQISRAERVYAARDGQDWVAAALIGEGGQILWLNGRKDKLVPAAVVLFDRIHTDLGACWGIVRNRELRAAYVEASGPAGHEDGDRIWWQP